MTKRMRILTPYRFALGTAVFCLVQWRETTAFSLTTCTPDVGSVVQPIGTALIDYSTATEFIKEHYDIDDYFGKDIRRTQPVYDARKGVLVHDKTKCRLEPAHLDECGFQLFHAPTKVQDFQNLKDVQRHYVKELQDLIPNALGVSKDEIDKLILWHPTLRGEELSVGSRLEDRPGLGPIASRAHIDTDVGAYGLEGVCNLVDKNRVDAIDDAADNVATGSVSLKEDLMKACSEGRRFLLLNLWRPLVPVSSAPLGVLATRYDDKLQSNVVFPNIAPSRDISHWYIYSNMQPDECLVFKQYDRRLDKQSDIWHCALDVQDSNVDEGARRKSFDIKAMVVLKEQVPEEIDRLKAAVRPALTWEESGEFCDSQAQQLKKQATHEN